MIKCNVCGYDNPLGRVHCVQCGTKIDLSKIVPESMAGKEKGTVAIKKAGGGASAASIGRTIWKVVDLVILAALVIGGLLMWQETAIKEIGVDAGATLAAKERSDALKTAWQTSAPLTQEFTEQMINSYINDPNSPRHFDYPPESAGNFGSRITKYQIELGDNQATAIAVGVIQVGSFSKRVIVRATGSLVGGPAARQIKLSSMFIGKLPLQSLPLGQKLMDLCAGSLFRFQFFDSEWKILKGAADVRLGGGKLVVTVGPAAAAAGS